MGGENLYRFVENNGIDDLDILGLHGKEDISVIHNGVRYHGKSCRGDVARALADAVANSEKYSKEHIANLRGVLKVAKRNVKYRGGCAGFVAGAIAYASETAVVDAAESAADAYEKKQKEIDKKDEDIENKLKELTERKFVPFGSGEQITCKIKCSCINRTDSTCIYGDCTVESSKPAGYESDCKNSAPKTKELARGTQCAMDCPKEATFGFTIFHRE